MTRLFFTTVSYFTECTLRVHSVTSARKNCELLPYKRPYGSQHLFFATITTKRLVDSSVFLRMNFWLPMLLIVSMNRPILATLKDFVLFFCLSYFSNQIHCLEKFFFGFRMRSIGARSVWAAQPVKPPTVSTGEGCIIEMRSKCFFVWQVHPNNAAVASFPGGR